VAYAPFEQWEIAAVDNVLAMIEIEDFVRWSIDLPIAVGEHGDWYRWWAGPRLIYTSGSQSMRLMLPGEPEEAASISTTDVLGSSAAVDLDGLVVYPGLALLGEF